MSAFRFAGAAALAASAGAALLGCAPAQAFHPLYVANADFEAPHSGRDIPGWVVRQHAGPPSYENTVDETTAASGKASFHIKRTQKQAYGLLMQNFPVTPDMIGKTLRLRAKLRSAGVVDGDWRLHLTFLAGGSSVVDQAKSDALDGDHDWTELAIETKVPPRTARISFGATLTGGGEGWLDDVHLEIAD